MLEAEMPMLFSLLTFLILHDASRQEHLNNIRCEVC